MIRKADSISLREAVTLAAKVGFGTLILSRAGFAQTATVPTTGTPVPELKHLDQRLVDYLSNNSCFTGANLAVARKGRV